MQVQVQVQLQVQCVTVPERDPCLDRNTSSAVVPEVSSYKCPVGRNGLEWGAVMYTAVLHTAVLHTAVLYTVVLYTVFLYL